MNIYEIARRAGVSIATVSRVINNSPNVKEATRDKVRAVLDELNYTPNAIARSLAINSTRTIGVLTSDVRDSYYASAVYTIEQELRGLGYNVILCNTGGVLEKKKQYMRILLEKKIDGMILVGSVFKEKNDNSHILRVAEKVPVVMLNSHLEGENIYSVVCDDSSAVRQVVQSLYQRGHRDIVYVYDVESFSGLAKQEGFKIGIKDYGLSPEPDSILQTESGLAGGIAAIERLEARGARYTALAASEDVLAAGMLKGLANIGKSAPRDKAVFGYNNSILALSTTPELSSVDKRLKQWPKNQPLFCVMHCRTAARRP